MRNSWASAYLTSRALCSCLTSSFSLYSPALFCSKVLDNKSYVLFLSLSIVVWSSMQTLFSVSNSFVKLSLSLFFWWSSDWTSSKFSKVFCRSKRNFSFSLSAYWVYWSFREIVCSYCYRYFCKVYSKALCLSLNSPITFYRPEILLVLSESFKFISFCKFMILSSSFLIFSWFLKWTYDLLRMHFNCKLHKCCSLKLFSSLSMLLS